MDILAIETSCDETSVAIVRDGRHILANVISSQIKLHQQFGGVVPELASREHIVNLVPVLHAALAKAGLTLPDVDAIAVTRGPGLAGALLVGVNAGKALAFALDKPFVGVNHLEGHIYSNWLIPETPATAGATRPDAPPAAPRPASPPGDSTADLPWQGRRLTGYSQPQRPDPSPLPPFLAPNPQSPTDPPAGGAQTDPRFPLICLVVSGGHSELLYMTGHGEYQMLGRTVDDAAGEAFDKVARIMGLGYPGGPAIQRAAAQGNPHAFDFPHSVMRGTFDFSFSGLKTAVLRKVEEFGPPAPEPEPAPVPAPAPEPVVAAEPESAPARRVEAPPPTRPTPRPAAPPPAAAPGEPAATGRPPVRMLGRTMPADPAPAPAEEDDEDLPEAAPAPAAAARRPESRPAPPAPPAPRPATPAEPPPARPTPSRSGAAPAPPPTAERPAAARPTAPPTPASEPPTAPPPATPRRTTRPTPSGPGLIRVQSERAPAQPLAPPAPPEPPLPAAPARDEPRILGEGGATPPDGEVPAFLRRGTTPASTPPIRMRPRQADPEVPAFLRERATPSAPPEEDAPPARPTRPRSTPEPPAPTRPAPPATRTGVPDRPASRPPTSAPSAPQRRETPAPPTERPAAGTPRPTVPPAPPPRATPSRPPEPPAPPVRRPAPPPPEEAPPPPLSRRVTPPPSRPAPKPQPLAQREIRPIPKSVQAGRPATDEDEADIDLDAEEPEEDTPPRRPSRQPGFWSDWLEADDSADDEPPTPRSGQGRRPVPMEGSRRPEASLRLPGSGQPATPEGKPKPPLPVADMAASFQAAAVDILVEKTVLAAVTYRARTVLVAGGVAANTLLRERLRDRLGPDVDLRYPPLVLCTDNAAMIAAAAYFRYDAGLQTDWTLDIDPNARYWE